MSGAMSYGQDESSSRNERNQGLDEPGRQVLQPQALATAGMANTLAQQYASSPFGYFNGQTGAQMAGTDPNTGLASGATQWMAPFANQEAAKYSAGGSLRGQWSPENTQNIIGGTLQGMAGQLIPLAQSWQQYTTGLPESVMNSRLGFLNSTTGQNTGLLGGSGSGESSSFGFKVAASGGAGGSAPAI